MRMIFGVPEPDKENKSILEPADLAFQDMAVLDIPAKEDVYRQLTAKVIKLITYAVHSFRFALLLKVDTDSFVFLDRFLARAEGLNLFSKLGAFYGGMMYLHTYPRKNGKWHDSVYRNLTGQILFPHYARGHGYVLSASLCRFLAVREVDDGTSSWINLPLGLKT